MLGKKFGKKGHHSYLHVLSVGRFRWVFPKIGGPKMEGLFHGKPYEQMDDLGVPLFLETPRSTFTDFNPIQVSIRKKKKGLFYVPSSKLT